ncbi:MAG: pyruvate dehydrogenase (acetyl-transferring) E1 component subunit alpha [archaeon]|nr:pyruvate dehydrogenase (acetyl-transferring) E1 component subunit alpha [archaeon]
MAKKKDLFEAFKPLDGQVYQVLDKNGKIVGDEPKLSDEQLKEMYFYMLYTRISDEKAVSLQRQGRMLTFAPVAGHEALHIGSAFALDKEDWVVPAFRETGIYLVRGMELHNIYLYWKGSEEGAVLPDGINMLPVSIPVGSQTLHGAGIGWAQALNEEEAATLTFFGDGATSEGEFHEAMNFAAVFKTNTVFMCNNNQYAISVPIEKQTASETIAQKSIAYGMPGIKVDGNDILAMYNITKHALDRARSGKGPSLIEAFTYRIGYHTTSDDPTKYRDQKEVDEWKKKDPILRFRKYLKSKKIWTEKYEEELQAKIKEMIKNEIKMAEAFTNPPAKAYFEYTYAEMYPYLKEQQEEMLACRKSKEDKE